MAGGAVICHHTIMPTRREAAWGAHDTCAYRLSKQLPALAPWPPPMVMQFPSLGTVRTPMTGASVLAPARNERMARACVWAASKQRASVAAAAERTWHTIVGSWREMFQRAVPVGSLLEQVRGTPL